MLKIGLTGNIASGKSEAEKIISKLGFKIIDLDEISHKILENDENAKSEILKAFNTLDRKALGKIIFSNKNKRKELENIIHPKLNNFIEQFFDENKDEKAVFVSGATIFEAGFDKTFDKIILIDAENETKIKRLMKRNNLSYDEALLRLNCQKNNKEKTEFVIENNSTLENFEDKIKNLLQKML